MEASEDVFSPTPPYTGNKPRRTARGIWNHIAGQSYSVYELRLYARGPIVYQGDRQFFAPQWGANRYAASHMNIPSSGASNFDLTISNGQLGIMVMRGDS
jgi:hypothetical protein